MVRAASIARSRRPTASIALAACGSLAFGIACGGLLSPDDGGNAATGDAALRDEGHDGEASDGHAAPSDGSPPGDTTSSDSGACTAGNLVTLASGEDDPLEIAVDGNNVYWINADGEVRKCAVGGCGEVPAFLAYGLGGLCGLAIDETNVYFSVCDSPQNAAASVMKCAKDGCNLQPTTVASPLGDPLGVATDGTNVYWADPGPFACWAKDAGPMAVERCSVSGCIAPTTIASSQCARRVAVSAARIYWTTQTAILECPLGGCAGSPSVVTSSPLGIGSIALDKANVYWTNPQDGTVESCPLAGCNGSPVVLASGQNHPGPIASDGLHVYWANVASGEIVRCAVGGCSGAPDVIVCGQNNASSIALDEASVYWTNLAARTVMKLTPK